MPYESFEQLVGKTPCVRFRTPDRPDISIWIKLESFNPTASVKDRACLAMLRGALDAGALKPGQTLLDASSGNFACALAYFGAILGHPVHLVCSSKLTDDKRRFIRFYGAELEEIGAFTIQGNQHCRDKLDRPGGERFFFLDQLHNPLNPLAHYRGTGPEILTDFPQVAAVVGSLGSGGTLCGTARYLKEANPAIRVYATQAATGSSIPGTGSFDDGDYETPFIKEALANTYFAERVRITEAEARQRTKELARQGFFCGLQTGGVVQAALMMAEREGLSGDIVCISGDSGWKNMDKLAVI